MSQEFLAKTDAGFRREAIFPVQGNWLEAGLPIEREGGGLPDASFEDQAPDAQCPGLGLESGHETPPQALPAHGGGHIHPLEFGRLGIEESQGAATDRSSLLVDDEEGAAPAGHLLGIQTKVRRHGLGIDASELGVQGVNQGVADVGGQIGAFDGDRFFGHGC